MPSTSEFVVLPDPGRASGLDGLAGCLRALKGWAGGPSYETITGRVNDGRPAGEQVGRSTVVDCFRDGRRRLDNELVIAVVQALHPDPGYVHQWRQALRVVSGEAGAAAQVRVRDDLPQDLPGFTGRAAALELAGGEPLSVLRGMAGVGKTRLAVHLGHRLLRRGSVTRVLFVDLRGFHPDEAQPPADPGAVLDGFLRLLGMPGAQVPYAIGARTAAFRERLAGTRTLVVLDNAAGEEQVRPLLAGVPGCVTLVTSRRRLAGLAAAHVDVDVFTPAESLTFLADAVPGLAIVPGAGEVPAAGGGSDDAGGDDDPVARIARRCGHLPLALALVAGRMRAKPGWTPADHADWLDERHQHRRLDSGVELALDVSYRELPGEQRALLRLLAQHPGQDCDASAAAALSGTTVAVAAARLARLAADHLVLPAGPGRFGLHDLVRAYAAARAADEDRRADRQAAVTALFDYYLATAADAVDRLHPADAQRRPKVAPSPVPPPAPDDPLGWLDAERANLVGVVTSAPEYAVRFGAVLFRYLLGGHHQEALIVHGRAAHAAELAGDPAAQAGALADLSTAEVFLGRHEAALDRLDRARQLFRQAGDLPGQARTLNNLGVVQTRLGDYAAAVQHLREAMELHREAGDGPGQARALTNLGNLESRMGHDEDALGHYDEALRLYRAAGDRVGEAVLLSNLGGAEVKLRRFDAAQDHLGQALALDRELRNQAFEASTLDFFGTLYAARGDAGGAEAHHREAMALFRRLGDRHGEACAHNGLGEAARVAGRAREAIGAHAAAYGIAVDPGVADREQEARAHTGLGDAHHALGELSEARRHYGQARELWAELSPAEAARVAERLAALDPEGPLR